MSRVNGTEPGVATDFPFFARGDEIATWLTEREFDGKPEARSIRDRPGVTAA